MKTYPVRKIDEALLSFEIDNSFVLLSTVKRILAQTKGISNITVIKSFVDSDILVEFDYLGFKYEVHEPYGDSNRLLIGPKEFTIETPDISLIENSFKIHKRYLLWTAVGVIFFSVIILLFLSN
jgi:hypothetical protein